MSACGSSGNDGGVYLKSPHPLFSTDVETQAKRVDSPQQLTAIRSPPPLSPLTISWQGKCVPAVRVGNMVMPMRRGTSEQSKVRAASHQALPANVSDIRKSDQIDGSPTERPQQTNTVHTSSELVHELYGLSPRHQVFNQGDRDQFIIMGPLGQGSLGVVEEVRTSMKKMSMVRKRVQIPYKRTARLEAVEREAAALRFLNHPHIVQLLGTYEEGVGTGRHFYSLLMAPVGDNDLRAFLDLSGERFAKQREAKGSSSTLTNPKELAWLLNWFQCLASALAYMHRQGFRHQDIKPSNIIQRGPDIFFTDFSSSSAFEVGATTSTETPAYNSKMYAAPETIKTTQSDQYQRHGLGSDIFSLGCVFAEMLTVLDGKKVSEFQEFCLHEEMAAKPEKSWSMLLYSDVTKHIDHWFEGAAAMNKDLYRKCIKPMLNVERKERPSADVVLARIRASSFWDAEQCSCP
jgi:serine/threonine protein kinase